MLLVNILGLAGTIVGVAGQFMDSYTTYQGVQIAGPGIEGNKSWLAQFIVNHFPLTLIVRPLMFAGFGVVLLALSRVTDGGSAFGAFAVGAGAAIMGFITAANNAKINKMLVKK
jgi:hypothetical protein